MTKMTATAQVEFEVLEDRESKYGWRSAAGAKRKGRPV